MELRPLAKSEMEVARVVWRLGRARVREVVEGLPAERGMDFSTVQTYLRRLKAKGYLRTEREGRADVYVPVVKPGSVIRDAIADFLNRTFGGEALLLVEHLIEERGLSEGEIDQLQARLDALKAEHRQKRGES
jgi:predicted transcriptional regulator